MNSFLVHAFDVIALSGSLLLALVIRQAMDDLHIRRTDPPQLSRARKLTFYSASAYLLMAVCFQNYWLINPTTASVALVASGMVMMSISILSVSMVSLALRKPPNGHANQAAHRVLEGLARLGQHVRARGK